MPKQEKNTVTRSRNGSVSAKSAQSSIPFLEWYENKIFRITENTYSLICSFDNAGYLSRTDAEKERKYNTYRAILCDLPANIHYEEIVYNCPTDADVYLNMVASKKPPYANKYEEAFFKVQRMFVGGVDRDHSIQKYLLVLSLTVQNDESPYGRLHETYVMLKDRFKNLGSDLIALAPDAVFSELFRVYNPFGKGLPAIPADIYRRGLTVQDFIAPDGMAFAHDHIRLGCSFARVMAVKSYGGVATDYLMYALCSHDMRVYLTKHIDHVDKNIAVKQVQRQLMEAEGRKGAREEKKRPIPIDLIRTIEGCNELLDAFADGEEFLRQTLYITVFADSLEQLNNHCERVRSMAISQGATLMAVTVQTANALKSILPLGKDYCTLHQFLLAGEAAVMTPFSYESYMDENGFFYGNNYHSSEPIIRNRKADKSSHGFVFGNTGSGKGIWVKNEITNVLFQPYCRNDEVVILDPSGEYIPLAQAVGGRIIELAADGGTHINPLYLSQKRIEQDGPQTAKVAKVRSLIALLSELKGSGGLTGIEIAVIDRAAMAALGQESPTLETLYQEISAIGSAEANSILTWLQRYTEGSVTMFAGMDTTDEDRDAKITVYALHKLPSDIRDAVMLTLLDKLDDMLLQNKQRGRWTWIYIDEMHRYFDADRNPYAAEHFARLYAEARKYGGILTGITQLPKPVIASRDGSTMLSNSRFVVMSELDDANIAAVTEKYSLNEEQQRTLYSAEIGQYVLRTHNAPISVQLLFPGAKPGTENALFDLFNTSFGGN